MVSVMGTRAGLRVVLDPEHRLMAMGHGRHGSVIEIEVGDLNSVCIQRIGREGKTVVLTCDLNLTRGATGMVQTSMAIGQLERLATEGQAKNLMTQTDPEQR